MPVAVDEGKKLL